MVGGFDSTTGAPLGRRVAFDLLAGNLAIHQHAKCRGKLRLIVFDFLLQLQIEANGADVC